MNVSAELPNNERELFEEMYNTSFWQSLPGLFMFVVSLLSFSVLSG